MLPSEITSAQFTEGVGWTAQNTDSAFPSRREACIASAKGIADSFQSPNDVCEGLEELGLDFNIVHHKPNAKMEIVNKVKPWLVTVKYIHNAQILEYGQGYGDTLMDAARAALIDYCDPENTYLSQPTIVLVLSPKWML